MDAIIKTFEARGHHVIVEDVPVYSDYRRDGEKRSATFVCIANKKIEFTLSEPLSLEPLPSILTDRQRRSRVPEKTGRPRKPTGNLCLTTNAGSPNRHWRDRARRKLE